MQSPLRWGHPRSLANRGGGTLSTTAASLLSEVGGASAPWKCAPGSLPTPPSHLLVQRLHAEGSHMVLCGHISLVQYLPGVNTGPGFPQPVSAVSPLPSCAMPCSQPAPQEWQVMGGVKLVVLGGSHAESGGLISLSTTPPHTLTQKTGEVKSNVSKSDPFLV